MARRASSWRGRFDRARGLLDGPIVGAEDGVRWLAQTAVDRVLDKWDAVIAITGEERVSKSTLMLRLDEEIERITGEPFDPANYCYGGRSLNAAYRRGFEPAYRKTHRTPVVDYDEGSRGLLAGETLDPEQLVITQLLANAGVVGAVLILCIPDIWLLAKKVRGRRAVFWVHVDRRGTPRRPAPSHAIVHERDRRIRYKRSDALGLSVSRRCPELLFEPYPENDPRWVGYAKVKGVNLVGLFDLNDEQLDRHEVRKYGRVVTGPNADKVGQTSDS